jgi:CelD/BcsL family acetyltransferase involved in cellulose biosynthesis
MSVSESGNWQIITGEADFLAIGDEWTALFTSNSRHRPFQAWPWVNAWLRHLAGAYDLSVICWRDDSGNLQFVLPLIRSTGNGRCRVPRLMSVCGYGPDCSDHLGCLRTSSLEAQQAEFAAEAIRRFCGNERVELCGVDGRDEYAQNLHKILKTTDRAVRLDDFAVCPTVALGASWDAFLQSFSSNFRSQTRRHYNRIAKQDTLAFESVDSAGSPQFAQELIRLNRSRMDVKGKVSSLEDPDFRAFLLEAIPAMTESGLAWLDVVKDGDQVVGAALNLIHGDTAYYYMGGFDDSAKNVRPGTALFARVIMRSIEKGYARYDFLRGAEAYKYRWGSTDEATYRLDIYQRGAAGQIAQLLDVVRTGTRNVVRGLRAGLRKSR